MKRGIVCLVALLAVLSCRKNSSHWSVSELPSPATVQSGQSGLHAYGTRVYMSWFQANSDRSRDLLFSQWNGQNWSAPLQIARSASFIVNWADFPSLVALENGMLVAQWSVKASGNPYSANLEIATSNNDGRSWSRPESPHKQQSNSEHGFAALSDSSMGRFAAFWLDGRNFSADPNKAAMMLVYSQYEGGRFSQESILDERVCDCCQTDAAPVPGGMIVVYRDRSSAEVRDIYYRKNTNGVWSKAKPLWNDGWKIEACPVNGPAISSFASHVAIAWFTGASNQPRVQIIFSADGGETFGKAIRIDNGNPIGRVDVDWLQNQNAMVTWMENNGEIRARLIRPDGSGEQSFVVAKSSNSQASGFPRLARFGKGAIVSWTDVKGEQLRVKVAAAIPN